MRNKLKDERWDYVRKLGIIQECIYGVDIQPIAIQISKLRFFISLLVDQREKPGAENRGFEALPNLDFKLVAANTLISAPQAEPANTDLLSMLADPFFEKFDKLTGQYFSANKPDDKKKLRDEISHLITNKCQEKIKNIEKIITFENPMFDKNWVEKNKKSIEEKKHDLKLWNSYKNLFKQEVVEFFEPKYFFPKAADGFDVVIGNPPYVDSETMTRDTPAYREILKSLYQSAKGNWDLFVVFVEKAMNLTVKGGGLSFIIPNKLISAKYAYDLRLFLNSKTVVELIDYSSVDVFKEADVYPIVLIAKNDNQHLNNVKTKVMSDLTNINIQNDIESDLFYKDIFWDKFFFDKSTLKLVIKLSEYNQLNKIFPMILGSATVNEAYQIKEYVKELDKQKIYFKFINTGTIDPYQSLWGIKRTQYIKESYLTPIITPDSLRIINTIRLKQSKSPKIIIAGMSLRIEAFFDMGEYCAGKSTSIILGESGKLKTLTGILNSKIISFWFSKYFNSLSMAGGYFNIGNNEIGQIPIPDNLIFPILELSKTVEYITFLKVFGNQKSSFFESLIDAIVYELYLPDEITAAGANILCHLQKCQTGMSDLPVPDIQPLVEKGESEKALIIIEKVYKEFSNPNHPVSIAMAKMQEIEEVKIIEGKK
ncbi:Eco57I restriction-modification methylase domain-containing protein [Candidatus Desantisbacteria bacterium]|nr:Eco57I restriction-modification methylase domain-containing protein [Candidatus Desantisbacteria bacterium]